MDPDVSRYLLIPECQATKLIYNVEVHPTQNTATYSRQTQIHTTFLGSQPLHVFLDCLNMNIMYVLLKRRQITRLTSSHPSLQQHLCANHGPRKDKLLTLQAFLASADFSLVNRYLTETESAYQRLVKVCSCTGCLPWPLWRS
jgi:hypothetical protein